MDAEAAQLEALKWVYFKEGRTDGVPRHGLDLVASMMEYKGLTVSLKGTGMLVQIGPKPWQTLRRGFLVFQLTSPGA